MRNEKMPILLLEREKINEIGNKIANLPPQAFYDPISFGEGYRLEAKDE